MQISFDWDQWNIQKNEIKHGVSRLEAESHFYDLRLLIYPDKKHSTKAEIRYISYGRSYSDRILMCAFTIRRGKIRIISVRLASKKERDLYEKEK
jgi:uncharacterized DUF497 family protein